MSTTEDVIIPLIPWTMYRDTDMEAQPTTSKQPPSALVYLNTEDLSPGQPRNNFVISNDITYFSNVSRITPVGCAITNYYIPNVNERNNTLSFFSTTSNLVHTVTLTEALYTSSATLMAEIVTRLNTVTGASGLTFSSSVFSGRPDMYNLAAAGGTYHIVSCTALTHGDTVYAFDPSPLNASVHYVGPMPLKYTLFVDVVSDTLTKFAKLRTISTNAKSAVFIRAFIGGSDWGNTVYAVSANEAISINFLPMQVVTTIDIRLYDSHGDILYIPFWLRDTLIFQMTFRVDL